MQIHRRYRNFLLGTLVLLGLAAAAILIRDPRQASASSGYLAGAETKYAASGFTGSRIDNCTLCHNSDLSRNAYGADFGANSHDFAAIESLDSDGDGFSNLVEILAHSYPGDANSRPMTNLLFLPVLNQ